MSDKTIIQHDMGRVAELIGIAPGLFDCLTACMGLQPIIDPDAGYGAFQIPTLYFSLELEPEVGEQIATKLGNDPYRFYTLVRGMYAAALDRDELLRWLEGELVLSLHKIYDDTQRLVPSFGKPDMLKHL